MRLGWTAPSAGADPGAAEEDETKGEDGSLQERKDGDATAEGPCAFAIGYSDLAGNWAAQAARGLAADLCKGHRDQILVR